MIAVDTNVLVYAHREELPLHDAARERLLELAEGRSPWAIPIFVPGEFLRIVTHHRVFDPPYTADEACEALARVLASPTLRILEPGPDFTTFLFEAVREGDATGNLVFDAQIVALCREHGVSRLLPQDRDFDRFEGLAIERLGTT